MTQREDEIAAHLTALRFVLEVILANYFAAVESREDVEAFIRSMKCAARQARSAGSPSEEDLATAVRSTELVGSLLKAATERAALGRQPLA